MKRYGVPNEFYTHKVINIFRSNAWVDVPVQEPAKEVLHKEMEDVVSCICCGVDETEVLKYRVKDVAPHLSNKSELKKEAVEEEK